MQLCRRLVDDKEMALKMCSGSFLPGSKVASLCANKKKKKMCSGSPSKLATAVGENYK
jgi:hypothetical protein